MWAKEKDQSHGTSPKRTSFHIYKTLGTWIITTYFQRCDLGFIHVWNIFCWFSQDDIHLAAGILDTNCFDLKCDKKVRIVSKTIFYVVMYILKVGRCIFLSTSMFNNNCEPNCVRKIEDCTVRIIAARFWWYEINGKSWHQILQGYFCWGGADHLLRWHEFTDKC